MTKVRTGGPVRADLAVVRTALVARGVELDAQEGEALGGQRPDGRRMLADAAGEDERVEPAERGRHRGDPGPQPVDVDVEREASVGLAGRRRAR